LEVARRDALRSRASSIALEKALRCDGESSEIMRWIKSAPADE
jgi:hypothetical protein